MRTMRPASALRRGWSTERPFLIALGLGALVRVLVQVAFPPAFVFSDGPAYLRLVDHLAPMANRPVGYGFVLRALSWLTRDVWAVAVLQHLLGLVTAAVVYALLRRRAVSPRVATLATLPVLFDSMQLTLEHAVLSDVVFSLLLVLAVAVLGVRQRPTMTTAALSGLLMGLAVCVRVVGGPVVLAGAGFCLLTAVGLRARVLTALAFCIAFSAPAAAYAAWYHAEHGVYALSQSGGRALYMRTTDFVDCSRFSMPAYERPLCPAEPVGQRPDPTHYGWHDPNCNHDLHPPAGFGIDATFRDFARRAIAAQPGAYTEVVVRDMLMSFLPARFDLFGYNSAHKWSFAYFVGFHPTRWNAPSYRAHGGEQPSSVQPLADVFAIYGYVVFLPGPVVLALLVLVVVGAVRRRPLADPGLRSLALLSAALGFGLAWAPDVIAEFTWRYQLPVVVLLPMAAAMAWTRLHSGPSGQPGDGDREAVVGAAR
jgi:hypothetical protein